MIPALIVVDMQEDFCEPHGSLAVRGGREIAPKINVNLLIKVRFHHNYPITLRMRSGPTISALYLLFKVRMNASH